jgi:DNA-directed RNA polymerase subunit RPC12/RpoP
MKLYACPSCGADVPFEVGGGAFAVCSHCQTLLFRGEKNLEKWGKVAELMDTEPLMALGMQGCFEGRPFRVIGRIQKTQGNAFWDEWHLSFEGTQSAWLSFSEGQWQLMFPQGELENFPEHSQLPPLTRFEWNKQSFVVEERDTAQTHAAAGQLPSFASTHAYVDATAAGGVFASIDFGGEKPELFLGKTVSFEALGVDLGPLPPRPRSHALAQARCPTCNGPLDLKAPDATRRVGCPYCNSLIDVSSGHLTFLSKLGPPPLRPAIPLGRKGRLQGIEWTCLALLVRSCTLEGIRYPWAEYLLWEPSEGFAWLVESNGHWSFLRPFSAADALSNVAAPQILESSLLRTQRLFFSGQHFKPFQSVPAVTEHVLGECYWEVTQGDRAFTADWICPPSGISLDKTEKEASFSLGEYVSHKQVQEAFGIEYHLPSPRGVAPTQPRYQSSTPRWSLIYGALALLICLAFGILSPKKEIAEFSFALNFPLEAEQKPLPGEAWTNKTFFHVELPQTRRLVLELEAKTMEDAVLETNIVFLPSHLEDNFDMETPMLQTYVELGHKNFGSGLGSHAELSRKKRLGPFPKGPATLFISWKLQNNGPPLDRPLQAKLKLWKESKAPVGLLLLVWAICILAIAISLGLKILRETRRWEESVFEDMTEHHVFYPSSGEEEAHFPRPCGEMRAVGIPPPSSWGDEQFRKIYAADAPREEKKEDTRRRGSPGGDDTGGDGAGGDGAGGNTGGGKDE